MDEEVAGNVNAEQQVDADVTIISRQVFLKELMLILTLFDFEERYFMNRCGSFDGFGADQ